MYSWNKHQIPQGQKVGIFYKNESEKCYWEKLKKVFFCSLLAVSYSVLRHFLANRKSKECNVFVGLLPRHCNNSISGVGAHKALLSNIDVLCFCCNIVWLYQYLYLHLYIVRESRRSVFIKIELDLVSSMWFVRLLILQIIIIISNTHIAHFNISDMIKCAYYKHMLQYPSIITLTLRSTLRKH